MPDAKPIELHIFPSLLVPGETIQDGPNGESVKITEPTLMLWVDLMPTYRFVHPTCTVLVGASGARALPGSWWSIVNCKLRFPAIRGDASQVVFPLDLGEARLHLLPGAIYPDDQLTDGVDGKPLPILQESIVFWLDLDPKARFHHPTQYVIIGAQGAEVVDGHERPTIRGNHHPVGISIVSSTRRTLLVEARAEPTNEPHIGVGGPAQVMDVMFADIARMKADPKRVTLTASGRVPTLGWSNARLVPHVYIQAPPDGIWGYEFVADPPTGMAATSIGTVSASIPLADSLGLSGVRIHAARGTFVLRVPEIVKEPFADGDPFTVESCKIEDDQLVMEVQTSGDANLHWFRLLWTGALAESNPPQGSFRLYHDARGDKSEETSRTTLRFDLVDLPSVVMHLSNAFGWKETVRYRLRSAD